MKLLKALNALAQLPIEKIWMLAVDGKFYSSESGPLGFEQREKGSIEGILNGLITAIKKLGTELKVADIQAIHKACMEGINSRNPCQPGEFRKNDVAFDVPATWCSPSGLLDLLKNFKYSIKLVPTNYALVNNQTVLISSCIDKKNLKVCANPQDALTALHNQNKLQELHAELIKENTKLVYFPSCEKDFAKPLEIVTKNYNQNIKLTKHEDQVLKIIAETIQYATRLHPFRDGNNRTFVNCLLNRLLIENGLPPALFFEPNVFEFHTPQELVEIIKNGQDAFNKCIDLGASIFNYDNKKIASFDNGKFITIGKQFKQQLSLIINQIARENYKNKQYNMASEYFMLNYQLELQVNLNSVNSALSLFSLASSLKELGDLQTARLHFSNAQSLFAKNNRVELENNAKAKIKEIDLLLNNRASQDNHPSVLKF